MTTATDTSYRCKGCGWSRVILDDGVEAARVAHEGTIIHRIESELNTYQRLGVGGQVVGRNRFTEDRVDGLLTGLVRSSLDGKVYATVDTGRGRIVDILADDLSPERNRCRRPESIPSTRFTGGEPQGTGYRCANCGKTVWYIRDGSSEGGERLTHDAALSWRQGF